MTTLRTSIELQQPYSEIVNFTRTTTGDTAETVLTVSSLMVEANKIDFMVDLFDLFVRFGGTATNADPNTNSILVPAGTGVSLGDIRVTGVISIINAVAGQRGRIRGYIAGRG